MKKEWILTEEEKQNKKRRIEENRRLRLTTTTQPDASNLDTTIIEPKNSPGRIDNVFQSVVLDHSSISSSLKLSAALNNGDVIANVVTAYNEGFQLNPTSYGWSYPLAKKLTALCQIMIVKNTTASRLISFYKRLHEFDGLHENDKVNLVKTNLAIIFFYHASLG